VRSQVEVKYSSVRWLSCLTLLCLLVFALPGFALTNEGRVTEYSFLPEPFKPAYTLSEAVHEALRNFPSIRAARFKLKAAAAEITLAKTEYLPNLDVLAQEIFTSHNIVGGTIIPQVLDVIPIQSGNNTGNSMKGYCSSNVGAGVSWLALDFGLRRANVKLAHAATTAAEQGLRLTELDVAYQAAEGYLDMVAAQETIRVARATVDRMKANVLAIHTYVDNGLRPGVDASRADYELSAARIALIDAEQATELARVDLAEKMGVAGTYINIDPDPIIRTPSPKFEARPVELSKHPLALLRASVVTEAKAKVTVIDKTWYPHLWLHGNVWGRGSNVPGSEGSNVAGGALPRAANYMLGASLSFPIMDYFEIKAKRKRAFNDELAEKANFDLAMQILEQKDARSRVLLTEARRVADETPIMVKAARENAVKTVERYKVGLANIVNVSEAERILARAEVDDALAQVRVWKAILATGYVQGDLRPFMQIVSAAEGKYR
jgi:outer membrane protein TolC